ncbi:ArsR/SmtB family transcription factor [Nesterenkonia xinjiangensis]|uniref:DNA-binding transcriptional ArsR family regulator n=1 Tax=Nesterenkonia xinjiangensis TaxID=225327 RepID=A0A7Z0GK39_9MICC|nr:metalloregulator ArsR/SmtB family transcription factor [Nesterenkonia xinjiangensis]NYJ77471.1 DNA-binding transcriptional ArsR family regulator [Nesterenkonia xinjiangensis]
MAEARDRDFARIGAALAAPARSTMLNLLMDGSLRPAGDLARAAQVSPSTASEHLAVLVDAGMITCTARGRRRWYALAGPEVAEALEALGAISDPAEIRGYALSRQAERLAEARLCYDHLAGRLGVALTEEWRRRAWLVGDQLALTEAGHAGISTLGVDVDAVRSLRRTTTRACLDWTMRRHHLAGALGAAVASRFLEVGWVQKHRAGRGLTLTDSGRGLLAREWDLQLG